MSSHTATLHELVAALFTEDEQSALARVADLQPLDVSGLVSFDASLGGPSMATLSARLPSGGTRGRYDIGDRDVFRPLQYCEVYFGMDLDDIAWVTREIVHMSSGHVEALVKRIGSTPRSPLGAALRAIRGRDLMDSVTESLVARFVPVYNDAKHAFDHDKDTHRYSVEDAVLAYFVCRRLGERLYPLARLATDIAIFDSPA